MSKPAVILAKHVLTRRPISSVVIIFFIGLIFGMTINQNLSNRNAEPQQPDLSTKENIDLNDSVYPHLRLPIKYFDEKEEFRELILYENNDYYQSYPSVNTTIKEFSNEIRLLRPKTLARTLEEFSKLVLPYDKSLVNSQYRQYGILSTNYLPLYFIERTDRFDVDGDGQKETIVTYNFTESVDAGSYRADIIKGNNIIFSVTEDNASITPVADTPDGFYAEWRSSGQTGARCCVEGYTKTRFILKNGKFEPLYEQEVKYLKIKAIKAVED